MYLCVEHSDYWRAVSCCDTHPDVQQPSKASPGVCQEEEGVCVCGFVCLSVCVCLSLQVAEKCRCRSIIISCSRTGGSPRSDSPHTQTCTNTHTNTCAAPLKNQSIHLMTLRGGPNYTDIPHPEAMQTHTGTHTHTHTHTHTQQLQTKALTHAQKVPPQKKKIPASNFIDFPYTSAPSSFSPLYPPTIPPPPTQPPVFSLPYLFEVVLMMSETFCM